MRNTSAIPIVAAIAAFPQGGAAMQADTSLFARWGQASIQGAAEAPEFARQFVKIERRDGRARLNKELDITGSTADATELALHYFDTARQVPFSLPGMDCDITRNTAELAQQYKQYFEAALQRATVRPLLPVRSDRPTTAREEICDFAGNTAELAQQYKRYFEAALPHPTVLLKSQFDIAEGSIDVAVPPLLPVGSDRPTTAREEIIGEIRGWVALGKNWDGEGADAPISSSLRDAEYFIDLLDVNAGYQLPDPMLLANGRAGLFWNEGELYADLEFLGDGRMTYFIEYKGQGKHKGVVQFRRGKMPPVFAALLRT